MDISDEIKTIKNTDKGKHIQEQTPTLLKMFLESQIKNQEKWTFPRKKWRIMKRSIYLMRNYMKNSFMIVIDGEC